MNLKILALDYGDARIGVARSDDLGMLAHPVMTVPAQPWAEAAKRIAGLVAEHRATMLLVGLPVREDGTEGTAAEKVRKFCGLLIPMLPSGFSIKFHDEYRSTETAKQHLRAAGRKEKTHRGIIDQVAAVVILQEYLDQQAASVPIPDFI
jgi:putative Holliday junction resolvase